MRPNWFNNRGQMLQLAVAVIACLFAGVKAWPEIKDFDFLGATPALFYIVLISAALSFALRRPFQSADTTTAPLIAARPTQPVPTPVESPHDGKMQGGGTISRFKLTLGQNWTLDGVKISLRDVRKNSAKVKSGPATNSEFLAEVDATFGGFFIYCGSGVKEITANRFVIPAITSNFLPQPGSIFNFGYSEDHIVFEFICAEHINWHSKEAELVYCRARVSKFKS